MNGGANDEDLLGFDESPPQLSEDLWSADPAAVAHNEAFSMDLQGFGTDEPTATNGGSHPLRDPIDLFGSRNETVEDLIQITPPTVDPFVEQPLVESEVEHSIPFSSLSGSVETAEPLLLPSPVEPETEQTLLFDSLQGHVETGQPLLVEPSPGDHETVQTIPFTSSDGVVGTAEPRLVERSPAKPETEQTQPFNSFDGYIDTAEPLSAEPPPVEPETEPTLPLNSIRGHVETAEPLLAERPPVEPEIEQRHVETAEPFVADPPPVESETEPTLPFNSLSGYVETAEPLLAELPSVEPENEQTLPIESLSKPLETAEPLLLVPSAVLPEIEQTLPFDSVSEPPETSDPFLVEPEMSKPSGSLESTRLFEQKSDVSLLDVPAASNTEASVHEGLQPTKLASNKIDLCSDPLSENDAGLRGKPLSELDCETLPRPDMSTEASLPVDPIAEQAETTNEGMKLEGPLLVDGPVGITTPSWASPDVEVDSAPTWASAVVTADVPTAKLDNLQTEPPLAAAEMSPSEAASMESIQEQRVPDPDAEALILELQFSIQEHLSEREAATERARNADERVRKAEVRIQELEALVQAKSVLETELKTTKDSLSSAMTDRENLLKELDKLREDRDEHERMQIVLSNRLNAAKKKEAAKANLAETLEDSVKVLTHDLEKTRISLKEVTATKTKLAEELKVSTEEYEQRIKKLETLLGEERRLNEDRKKKMKSFVENKQEEVREAKVQNDELNMELSQTNRSLREHHARWKQLHAQWVQSQTRNRELQRDINRMKMESENMSRMGDQMNVKLSQRAQETETHKNKRLTAKQELMTVLETLEAEREVTSKLQDSIKFTFTPKALSQQQILKENLRDFEYELVRLSQRLGKPLPPSHDTPAETFAIQNDDNEVEPEGGTSGRKSRSQIDATHLLSNLEDETQRVSQCIMALTANIERLHVLIAQSGERTCATLLSDLLVGTVAAPAEEESGDMGGARLGLGTNRRYGQVPTGHD